MALCIQLNGQSRVFADLNPGDSLQAAIAALELNWDRIAVEKNGDIAPRTTWTDVILSNGDRLEIVHFVGGGVSAKA